MHLCKLQFKIIHPEWNKHRSWAKPSKDQTSIKSCRRKRRKKEVPTTAFPKTPIHLKQEKQVGLSEVCRDGNRPRNRKKTQKYVQYNTLLFNPVHGCNPEKQLSYDIRALVLCVSNCSFSQLQAQHFGNYSVLDDTQGKTWQLPDHLGHRYTCWNLPFTSTALKHTSVFCQHLEKQCCSSYKRAHYNILFLLF